MRLNCYTVSPHASLFLNFDKDILRTEQLWEIILDEKSPLHRSLSGSSRHCRQQRPARINCIDPQPHRICTFKTTTALLKPQPHCGNLIRNRIRTNINIPNRNRTKENRVRPATALETARVPHGHNKLTLLADL